MVGANTKEHYPEIRKKKKQNTSYRKEKIYHITRGRELKHVYVGSVLHVVNFCYCEKKIHHVWYGGLNC